MLKIYLKSQCACFFGAQHTPLEETHAAIDLFVEKGEIPPFLDQNFYWEDANWPDARKKEVFLTDLNYRVHHAISAALCIAQSMCGPYGLDLLSFNRQGLAAFWDRAKGASPSVLQQKIQGSLSKDQVLAALDWYPKNPRIEAFLNKWIDEATEKRLAKLVSAWSGSSTLPFRRRLNVSVKPGSDRLPEYHTCFYTMDLSGSYKDYDAFKSKLEFSLDHAKGFQIM